VSKTTCSPDVANAASAAVTAIFTALGAAQIDSNDPAGRTIVTSDQFAGALTAAVYALARIIAHMPDTQALTDSAIDFLPAAVQEAVDELAELGLLHQGEPRN
jgi:hypothetical protein